MSYPSNVIVINTMFNRLADAPNVENAADFIIRKRRPLLIQLFLIFVVAFAILYFAGINTTSTTGHLIYLGTLILVVGSLAWFTMYFSISNRDLVMMTEFQNALFASAAGMHSRFCFIVKRDGTIVYFDPGFQTMFPYFKTMDIRTIDSLLEHENVPLEVNNKIYQVLQDGRNDRVVVNLKGDAEVSTPMMITIDSLPRPRGFWVLRGREFIEARAGTQSGGTTEAVPMLLANMMNTLDVGMYATSPEGKIHFINRSLERQLGYGDNEIVTRNLGIQDIIYQISNGRPGEIEVDNFEGEVTFQKKTGALMKAHIAQSVSRDSDGIVMGATAIIHSHEDVKKKPLNP